MSTHSQNIAGQAVDPERLAAIVGPTQERELPRARMSNKRIASVAVAAVLVLAAGGSFAVFKGRGASSPIVTAAIAPVIELAASETFLVKPADIRHTVSLSGSLRPLNQVYLKAEVAARVSEVLVREGEPVSQGQVLARLDVSDLTSKLTEKLSNLEQTKAQLALAEKTRAAKLALKEKGYATQATVNEVESSYRVQLATVRAIEAQIDIARKALGDAVIRAPIAGFVGERNINPGEKVALDGKLFTIVDLAEMEIEAMISTNDIARVAVGQTVEFVVPGLEQQKFTGRVARINPTAKSGSRSIPVYIQVRNEGRDLRGGMFAAGEIVIDRAEQLVAVPVDAVRTDAGERVVLKIADGVVRRQSITLKGEPGDTGLIAVGDGLVGGDTIISAASIKLDAGTRVRIGGK
ncbi:MAG: efflux RND transporter periplasmic adaptor subunit [Hyphomicrobiaceae bacterium]